MRVGGVDLAELDPDAWRAQVSWMPQRPHLFAASIADNIAPRAPATRRVAEICGGGRGGRPARGAWRASRQGSRRCSAIDGAGLSVGERQRVALARAFLRDAPLLLLDEPTANLDGATEDEVLAALRRLVAGPHRGAGRAPAGPGGAGRPRARARRAAGGGMMATTADPTAVRRDGRPRGAGPGERWRWRYRPVAGRLALATLLGAGALGAGIGLIATSAWLISRASQRPPESALAIAIVAVQFFGLSRGLFRYGQRLVGHDVAFRSLADAPDAAPTGDSSRWRPPAWPRFAAGTCSRGSSTTSTRCRTSCCG